jgi:hypothetical protein
VVTAIAAGSVGSNGQKVWIKAGTHTVPTGAGFNLTKRLEVEGYNITRGDIDPHLDGTEDCPVLQGQATTTQTLTFASGSTGEHCYIKNLVIDANDIASSVGIYVAASGCVARNVKVINWKASG